ncbi:16S rRNA (guanine(527)-N(7))-methyltransferase RsmG [Pokkaliibacter sp. CJK22405]|uniref:16S rRNA (guanine(527)-N(7))-methyltransferase RsmG n=1 Tax=Pokkaliibacter sp. CJK22405 TaxID=3384615 RepID=UPI0039848180
MQNQAQLEQQLRQGLAKLGLSVEEGAIAKLMAYLGLLVKWNQTYNLTAVRDPQEMVWRHLLDSVSVHPHLIGDNLIDVGTGAGLPGIPLAILNPQRKFTLLDSNGKRTRFLTQVKLNLGLENVVVVNTRVESWQPQPPFDAILSRAFASVQDMVNVTRHLLAPNGCFLAMKGQYPGEEIAALPAEIQVKDSFPLEIPGGEGERHLVVLQQN